jgi:hypothetical protein
MAEITAQRYGGSGVPMRDRAAAAGTPSNPATTQPATQTAAAG